MTVRELMELLAAMAPDDLVLLCEARGHDERGVVELYTTNWPPRVDRANFWCNSSNYLDQADDGHFVVIYNQHDPN
jgi:hypothetical protein